MTSALLTRPVASPVARDPLLSPILWTGLTIVPHNYIYRTHHHLHHHHGKFFSSVFTNDNHVTPQIDKLVDPDIELSDVHFSPDLVWRAINKLKAKHSSGPDGYSSDFIKHLANSISLPLTLLFATYNWHC